MHLRSQSNFLYLYFSTCELYKKFKLSFYFNVRISLIRDPFREKCSSREILWYNNYYVGQARITLRTEVKFENFVEIEVKETIIIYQ